MPDIEKLPEEPPELRQRQVQVQGMQGNEITRHTPWQASTCKLMVLILQSRPRAVPGRAARSAGHAETGDRPGAGSRNHSGFVKASQERQVSKLHESTQSMQGGPIAPADEEAALQGEHIL